MWDSEISEKSRFQTSYLKTIQSASNPKYTPKINRNSLDTSIIPGAQASSNRQAKINSLTNRSHFFTNADIKGSQPTVLIPKQVNKQNDRHLNNRDIAYSFPQKNLFETNRVTNPLNPEYILPSVDITPDIVIKQKRVTNKIDDIQGTHAQPLYGGKMRDHINYGDIPGSQVGKLY